jgi:hypothetical protein
MKMFYLIPIIIILVITAITLELLGMEESPGARKSEVVLQGVKDYVLVISSVSPNEKYTLEAYRNTKEYNGEYYKLFVINSKDKSWKQIYSGDFRTLNWEWESDGTVKITYNCGTRCSTAKLIDVINPNSELVTSQGRGKENGWEYTY